MKTLKRTFRLGVVAALLAGVLPAVAPAHYVRVNWSYKDDCVHPRDPVTLVAEGRGATFGRVLRDIEKHTGWRNDDRDAIGTPLGEVARFTHNHNTGHGCERQAGERANAPGPYHDRFHLRFLPIHANENGIRFVFMTPHKEDWVASFPGCPFGSHAVEPGHVDDENKNEFYKAGYYSGFDSARDRVVNRLVSTTGGHRRHTVDPDPWRNTRSMRQCNGWWSGSGGVTYVYRMGRR